MIAIRRRRAAVLALLLAVLTSSSGCGGGPAVLGPSSLPVRRVVLYRNGVAYFERAGQLDGEALTFHVRREEVGDFLSSLTAIEQSGGGVRSVSFQVPEPPSLAPVISEDEAPLEGEGEAAYQDPDPASERVDVTLRLASADRHDLLVAYVVGAPIWRPSYRVVLDGSEALLQAWAVVQNVSGEDWHEVELSLTTGAPIAFRSDLGTPITPARPLVTDTGEIMMAVPESETALAQGGLADEPSPAPPPGMEMESAAPPSARGGASPSPARSGGGGGGRRRAASTGAAAPMDPGDYYPQPARPMTHSTGITAAQAQQSVTSLASVAVLGERATRYDIEQPVTVPNGGSTMVVVLSSRVPGESAHLFAPDAGVPLSAAHPFRVVRVVNSTGAHLERGPISVLGQGSFLGQGVLEALPRDATAFVPFALDRSVAVESSVDQDEAEGRLVQITRSSVVIERFSQRTTRYRIRNGTAEPTKVYVRHARLSGADITSPPDGTEMTADSALIPSTVDARGEHELRVQERTPVRRTVDFMTTLAADAVGIYLSGAAAGAPHSAELQQALAIRSELIAAQNRLAQANGEASQLASAAQETRQNLEAVRTLAQAADLRQRLVRRLAEIDERMAILQREMIELRTNMSELEVRLSEALLEVTLEVPPR